MKNKQKLFKLNLILVTLITLSIFIFGDHLRFKIFIKEVIFPKEIISKKFIFKPSIDSVSYKKIDDGIQTINTLGKVKVHEIHKKGILDIGKEIHDCEEEFEAIFDPFLNGENKVEVDNSRAILVLEELENFDFRNDLYKKGYKKGADLSPCSNQSNIVLLNQLFSENALDSWTNNTLQKMRNVLTGLLIDMSKLPGSIEDFENIFIQLELIHEKNLFEGVYREEMKRLRSEFEEVKGVFEIRDFVLESENNKKLKNFGSSEELLKKFKQKTRNFLHSTLKDFYSP